MKNIYPNIFSFNNKILYKCISFLKKGSVVGLPTETVYGLAGNAYKNKSVKNIYKLKKRPKKNPLIIHYYDFAKASNDVILNNDFFKLYKRLCPGPLTFVVKKRKNSKISSIASSNLETIAIRFPKHQIIRKVLKKIDFPLAMPSANISTGVSPVCAENVYDEFKNKIKFIIDGGKSKIGIESTVIDLTNKPKILRPGVIDGNLLKKFLKKDFVYNSKKSKLKSPGMMKKHYSPGIPIFINQKKPPKNHAFITFGKKYRKNKNYFNLSKNGDLKEAAANLYQTFRKIKKLKFKKIFVIKIPNKGVGIAINDRITRASK